MKSASKLTWVLSVLLVVFLSALLGACGGDGDGDGDDGGAAVGPYTGLTTRALIDEDNAEDLAVDAYVTGNTGTVAGALGAVDIEAGEGSGLPHAFSVSRALEDSLQYVDLLSRSGGIVPGAVYEETDTVNGDCGGRASYSISVDDVTGEFSGSFSFDSFCTGGTIFSGSVTFSGEMDVATGDIITFTFSFDSLNYTSGSESFTLDGDISCDVNDASATCTMDMYLTDNNSGKVYWARDYEMTWTEGSGYGEFEWSGRYYDPDYGYVDISTNTPFVIYDGDAWPSEGVLVIRGETGSAGGRTRARLDALSSTTYRVQADTDGDGSYDCDSGELLWADL